MTATRTGVTVKRRELADRAQALRAEGKLQREVAEILGVSRSYAAALSGEDPLGVKSRARKDSYRGVCEDCGGPTDGSNGPNAVPAVCDRCSHGRQTRDRKWSYENVIDAIQRFAAANGRPPTATEWVCANPTFGYPPRSSVYRASRNSSAPFQSWADAIETAGFPRPLTGHYKRPPKAESHQAKIQGKAVSMRYFVVLEQQQDGSWITHEGIQAYSEAIAIERYIESLTETNGHAASRFFAVPAHRWIVRELQPVTSYKAIAVEAPTKA